MEPPPACPVGTGRGVDALARGPHRELARDRSHAGHRRRRVSSADVSRQRPIRRGLSSRHLRLQLRRETQHRQQRPRLLAGPAWVATLRPQLLQRDARIGHHRAAVLQQDVLGLDVRWMTPRSRWRCRASTLLLVEAARAPFAPATRWATSPRAPDCVRRAAVPPTRCWARARSRARPQSVPSGRSATDVRPQATPTASCACRGAAVRLE